MIKLISASLLIFSMTSLPTFSQYFDGGVVGGLSASQVDGDTYWGFNKLGLLGGGWVKRMLTYNIGAQLELIYIGKGAYKPNKENDPVYYKASLHFIDIPVCINYLYRERVAFDLGLEPELLVSAKEEDAYGVIPEEPPYYRKLSLSAFAGIGYRFFDQFIANVRYNYSVIPIRKHASGQHYRLNRGQYNNVLTFSIYYQISH